MNESILVVDDEPDIRELVSEILSDEGYAVRQAEDGAAAHQALAEQLPDLVLLDIWMPDVDGISLLRDWKQDKQHPFPVIMMSGHGNVETAVEATRLGAYDYLEKPLSMAKLLLTVQRALEVERLARENRGLRRHSVRPDEPLGKSQVMVKLREQARRLGEHHAPVLLSGEPGAGKDLFARYMHLHSERRNGPFVDVRVGSIAAENSARELFGARDGDKVMHGRLEQAAGGTLFLEDIADMDLESQSRLLSALESNCVTPVGGNEPLPVDVRVMAATNRDLPALVAEGRFREDLFYRLNVLPINIPPLRDHREDVPELLAYYADALSARDNQPYRQFSFEAQNLLRNYRWPGNVRELRNLVQRLLILSGDQELGVEAVAAAQSAEISRANEAPTNIMDAWLALPLREAREHFEREYFKRNLERVQGSVGEVAKIAGMERTNLYRKLKGLGLS